jgi:hypothetical protein
MFSSSVWLKKHVKNTGIPVFTGILMAVYRYSAFAISIHSILRQKNKDRIELHVLLFCPGQVKD